MLRFLFLSPFFPYRFGHYFRFFPIPLPFSFVSFRFEPTENPFLSLGGIEPNKVRFERKLTQTECFSRSSIRFDGQKAAAEPYYLRVVEGNAAGA